MRAMATDTWVTPPSQKMVMVGVEGRLHLIVTLKAKPRALVLAVVTFTTLFLGKGLMKTLPHQGLSRATMGAMAG